MQPDLVDFRRVKPEFRGTGQEVGQMAPNITDDCATVAQTKSSTCFALSLGTKEAGALFVICCGDSIWLHPPTPQLSGVMN